MKQSQSMCRVNISLLLLCLLLPGAARAADDSNERILFLTLRFDKTSVQLLSSKTVSGHLKTNRAPARGEILYELLGDSGLLLQGTITNPLVRQFEYEDPDRAGSMISKTVDMPEATITLRVPYHTSIKQLTFYRTNPPSDTDATTTRSARGTVDLTSVHGGER